MLKLKYLLLFFIFSNKLVAQPTNKLNITDFKKMDSTTYLIKINNTWINRFTDTNTLLANSKIMIQEGKLLQNYPLISNAFRFQCFYNLYLKKDITYGLINYDSALYYANKAKSLKLTTECFTLIAGYYYDISDFQTSIIYYSKALQSAKDSKESNLEMRAYNNIANAYQQFGNNLSMVEENYINAIQEALKIKDYSFAAFVSGNLAEQYSKLNKVEKTKNIIKSTLHYLEIGKIENYNYAATLYGIGSSYFNLNNLDSAEYYNLKALKKFEEIIRVTNSLGAVQNLANIYFKKNNLEKCNYYSVKLLDDAKTTNNKIFIRNAYQLLSKLEAKKNNFSSAYQYALLFNEWSDTINTINNAQTIANFQSKSELLASMQELKFKTQLDLKENNKLKELNNSLQTQRWLGLLAALLFAAFCITLWFTNSRMKKQNLFLASQKQIIEQQSNERGTLIQEIHHRVKNNLTMLQSLQYLQAKNAKQEETKQILKENQARILSMALVHQNLYDANDNEKLNFKLFLNKLVNETISTYNLQSKTIHFNIEGNDLLLPLTIATPLALIMNELITNSLKYAFKDLENCKIKIYIEHTSTLLKINYSDNGQGLPKDVTIDKGGFGFKLLNILSSQLNGNIKYLSSKEPNFVIEIPLV